LPRRPSSLHRSARPTTFYFLTAEDATFNPGDHGVGWRLRPAEVVGQITFDLIVSNVTADKQLRRRMLLGYLDETTRMSFGFADDRS
jgi:hypothetical protein